MGALPSNHEVWIPLSTILVCIAYLPSWDRWLSSCDTANTESASDTDETRRCWLLSDLSYRRLSTEKWMTPSYPGAVPVSVTRVTRGTYVESQLNLKSHGIFSTSHHTIGRKVALAHTPPATCDNTTGRWYTYHRRFSCFALAISNWLHVSYAHSRYLNC